VEPPLERQTQSRGFSRGPLAPPLDQNNRFVNYS